MSDQRASTWKEQKRLELEVIRSGRTLAAESGLTFREFFTSDSLAVDVARFRVRRAVRRQLQTVTPEQIELAIEECLTP